MTVAETFEAGGAHQIGRYADAEGVPAGSDQILVSGAPGLAPDGSPADDGAGQAAQAWRDVELILNQAGASLADIVATRPAAKG